MLTHESFAVTRELKKRKRPCNNDAIHKSCNLIGAAVYRWQAQVHVLQVTRPSLPAWCGSGSSQATMHET